MVDFQFDLNKLRLLICAQDAVPAESEGIVLVDYALSDEPRSDLSCLLAARVACINEIKNYWITEVIADKWEAVETAYQIGKFLGRHNPDRILIERLSGWQYLRNEIVRQAQEHAISIRSPITFFKPSKKEDAKRNRIHLFYDRVEASVVHFVWGTWHDVLFESLTAYTGERKNRGRKDDAADCAGYLALYG